MSSPSYSPVRLQPSLSCYHSFMLFDDRSVGEDEDISIKDVADSIVKSMDFKGEYLWDTTKADGQFRKTASNEKLLKLMGGFQFTPFEQGASYFAVRARSPDLKYSLSSYVALNESVQWLVDNYDNARTGKRTV